MPCLEPRRLQNLQHLGLLMREVCEHLLTLLSLLEALDFPVNAGKISLQVNVHDLQLICSGLELIQFLFLVHVPSFRGLPFPYAAHLLLLRDLERVLGRTSRLCARLSLQLHLGGAVSIAPRPRASSSAGFVVGAHAVLARVAKLGGSGSAQRIGLRQGESRRESGRDRWKG